MFGVMIISTQNSFPFRHMEFVLFEQVSIFLHCGLTPIPSISVPLSFSRPLYVFACALYI